MNMVSLNVRSVASDNKRKILEQFIRRDCKDRKVIALNETHLQDGLSLQGWNANQSQFDTKGGVWTAVRPNQFKNVMHFKQNLCWTMVA